MQPEVKCLAQEQYHADGSWIAHYGFKPMTFWLPAQSFDHWLMRWNVNVRKYFLPSYLTISPFKVPTRFMHNSLQNLSYSQANPSGHIKKDCSSGIQTTAAQFTITSLIRAESMGGPCSHLHWFKQLRRASLLKPDQHAPPGQLRLETSLWNLSHP